MTTLAAAWPEAATDLQGGRRVAFEPMTEADLEVVCEVEKLAYAHPWSRRHFADSLASGYPAVMLLGEARPGEVVYPPRADGRVLLGYLVAMPGVDEVHLLNITVAPSQQRQGWARFLLDALALWSRGQGAQGISKLRPTGDGRPLGAGGQRLRGEHEARQRGRPETADRHSGTSRTGLAAE